MDLEARVRQELDENPALELKEGVDDDAAEDTGPADFEEAKSDPDGELVITENNELDFHRLDALARDYGDAYSEEHRPSRAGLDEEGDRKHDAMSNTPSRPQSLQDYLNEQVGFLELASELSRPDRVSDLAHRRRWLSETLQRRDCDDLSAGASPRSSKKRSISCSTSTPRASALARAKSACCCR